MSFDGPFQPKLLPDSPWCGYHQFAELVQVSAAVFIYQSVGVFLVAGNDTSF